MFFFSFAVSSSISVSSKGYAIHVDVVDSLLMLYFHDVLKLMLKIFDAILMLFSPSIKWGCGAGLAHVQLRDGKNVIFKGLNARKDNEYAKKVDLGAVVAYG